MQMKRAIMALSTLLLGLFMVGVVLITAVSAQTGQANKPGQTASPLELISEATGFRAALQPITEDCSFSQEYQVYLCEEPAAVIRHEADPRARARALALLSSSGLLFIPDSTSKRIMAFDPEVGGLVDPNFILLDEAATGTVIHAILGPSQNILVSDQTRDVVHEYDLAGNYLGIFAPAGGANTAILDNVRGMALRPNGNLLVTVGAGPNVHAIAEFDTAGNYLGNFVANGSGGMGSPFDVYERPAVDWLVSGFNSDAIHRYHLETGAYINNLTPIDAFPQQMYQSANGNILVANFSGTQTGIVELTADGSLVGIYNPPETASYRGVYQLPNGNLLSATSDGVFEIDRNGVLVDSKFTGVQSRFIQLVNLSHIAFRKTVGTDAATCAPTDEITVFADTTVYYCFEVTNNTGITLTMHDLVDSHLGVILDDYDLELAPAASVFVTQSAVITETTINSATWTAYDPGPVNTFTAESSANVSVVTPSISLTVTVGTEPATCAATGAITVVAGTIVYYCYSVTNDGDVVFTDHMITDTTFGQIDSFVLDLLPGVSEFFIYSQTIVTDVTSTVTWLAQSSLYTAEDSDTVAVVAVPPAHGVSLAADEDELAGLPGSVVTFDLRVKNEGNIPDTFALSFADNEWSVAVSVTETAAVNPGAWVDFTATVTIPSGAMKDDWDSVTILAESLGDGTKVDSVVLTTSTLALYGVRLEPETDEQAGLPNHLVAYTLTLTNTGNAVDSFDVTHAGSNWTVYIPDVPVEDLEPGQYVEVIVYVLIPGNAQSGATDNLVVTAASHNKPELLTSSTLITTVEWHRIFLPLVLKP
jgi:hypothetical protein